METEARVLLEKVTAMVEWYAENEPERLARRGIQAVLYAASDLEEALEALDGDLSDPGADSAGLAGHDHPQTSKDAAWDVMPRTGTQRLAVLDVIATSAGGMTDEEIRASIEIRYSSECARRKELVDGGWIVDSGKTRPTETGNEAIVWVLSDKGRAEFSQG